MQRPFSVLCTLTVIAVGCSVCGFAHVARAADDRNPSLDVRAEHCRIKALVGRYNKIESARGSLIQLATDARGNPAHAVGDFKLHLPIAIPDGTYRVSIRWRSGTMGGTPWAYLLGTESGQVIEHGVSSGRWHYFYPGHSESHNDRWFTQDLAGPNPLKFSMWPNSLAASAISVSGVEPGGFYVRIRDMSPGRDNAFAIESIALTRIATAEPKTQTGSAVSAVAEPQPPVGEAFTIGVYYAMPWLEPKDSFSWDYAFMDMARSGCNFVVISGNCWADQWAAIKHWDMRGVTSYGQLNAYPGPGKWKPADFVLGIQEQRQRLKSAIWKGEHVGDACVGHIMTDEPECRGLPEDKQKYLRAWADVYHQHNPGRRVYVNHCDPKWYDLHEKHATCSAAPTIAVNSGRITERIQAARAIGLQNFTMVALLGRMSDWSGNKAAQITYWNMGQATPEVFAWLASRTNGQDAYEQMITAYCFGAQGFHPFMYNQHRAVSLVDRHGNGQYGIRKGFSDAAHDLRRSHGWPGVSLSNNGSPFADRGTYSASDFTLKADAVSDSGTIAKVVFGKSTDGGGIWETHTDDTMPFTARFTTEPGQTVIFRARAVAADGRKSIYAANMIHIKPKP